jgi:hypothetical protein
MAVRVEHTGNTLSVSACDRKFIGVNNPMTGADD